MNTTGSSGKIVLCLGKELVDSWKQALVGTREVVSFDECEPDDRDVHYGVVWNQREGALSRFANLKAIFSMGAGVDHVLRDPLLPNVPIVRVVSPYLTRYMVEYVTWRVFDHLRQGATYRAQQLKKDWSDLPQPSAAEIRIGIMGYGELGQAVGDALKPFGFPLQAWTKNPRNSKDIKCFHGPSQLNQFLSLSDILVVLLPLTPETKGILNLETLAQLPRKNVLGGAVLINAGRGKLQVEADISEALKRGYIREASLDVFESEPLPVDSPLWDDPRVFITPHAAAVSGPRELAPQMIAQMDSHDAGHPLENLVNRKQGY